MSRTTAWVVSSISEQRDARLRAGRVGWGREPGQEPYSESGEGGVWG